MNVGIATEEQALSALYRAAMLFQQQLAALLKPGDLSATQYNVLRILRCAGPDGLPCGEVANRMINRDPDMTRLLDRMESRGLVERARQKQDRRVILVRITPAGERIAERFEDAVTALMRRQFAPLSRSELRSLAALLERLHPTE